METNPEYFGAYPAPLETPHGAMLRYKQIMGGVFALETEQGDRMIAIAIRFGRMICPIIL